MGSIRQGRQSRLLITAVLPLTAYCALSYSWLIQPLQDQLEKTRSHGPTLSLLLTSRAQEQSRLADSCALLEKQQKQLQALSAPLGSDPLVVLQSFLELGLDNQVELQWKSPENQQRTRSRNEPKDLCYQIFGVELEGRYHNLRSFFEGVSQLDCVLRIDRFEIDTLKAAPGILRARLTIQVPYQQGSSNGKNTKP